MDSQRDFERCGRIHNVSERSFNGESLGFALSHPVFTRRLRESVAGLNIHHMTLTVTRRDRRHSRSDASAACQSQAESDDWQARHNVVPYNRGKHSHKRIGTPHES